MKIYLIFFLSILNLPGLRAQYTDVTCRHFNVQNGLLSNYVEYVYVDQEGYVWFASTNGLQQYDGYDFHNYNYNADDNTSISYDFITSISEDSLGKIWVGTLGKGVDILNKEEHVIHHLRNNSSNNQLLTSNVVPRGQENLVHDNEGNIWINTDNGLNKINTKDYSIEKYKGDFIGEILYDKKDNALWIASNVLKKFNPLTRVIEYFQIFTENNRTNINVNSFKLDNEGYMWFGTNNGLFIFDKANSVFYNIDEYFKNKSISCIEDFFWSREPIESIYIDDHGSIWFAVEKELVKLNIYNGTFSVIKHEVDNPGSILDEKIAGIYGSREGQLWIVYNSMGVSRLNISAKAFNHLRSVPGKTNSLSGNTVRSVFQDNAGDLWVGNYSEGLNRIRGKNHEKIDHFKWNPANGHTINSNRITSIFVDSKKRLWVGTFDKGFCYADQIYSSHDLVFNRFKYDQNLEVQTFCEDAAGNIWIGTQEGLYIYDYDIDQLVHYGDMDNQLPELQMVNIQSIVYESPNIFWITSWNRGICKLKVESDKRLTQHFLKDSLIFYENIKDVNNYNIDNCFISICKDGNIIWLGSNVNGLVKMVLSNNGAEFIKYDHSRGAPGNSVYAVVKDENGNIWLSTNQGLGKFDPADEKFYNYYENDGLLSNAFVWNSYFQNQDGRIFFGSVNGLIYFFPEEISEESLKNTVHISRLIVNNKELQIGDKVNGIQILTKSIQYTNSITLIREPAFTIEFVAVNPINPQEIIYRYKLDGYDKNWTLTTSENRFATYSNLNQGIYTFLVKASNNIGDLEQNSTALTIKILPPWWQTTFALTAFSMLFLALLVLLRYLILTRIRLIHEAKFEHLERQKTDELFQFKMSFFTDISHEFGNLLSLILSPLQNIAAKVGNDPELAEQSRLIRKNSERLLRLTEQVIDMRKIDLNKMKLTLEKRDFIEYVRELTFSFREIATCRNLKLDFSSEVDSYLTWFDENKIDRIISNLLSNAFKFTPDGGEIQVIIRILKEPGKSIIRNNERVIFDEYFEISVRDTGIGIPAIYRSRVFERFLKIERNSNYVRRGTGIGLALTKELTELMNGNIRFESEENKGSCFIIQLPVIKDPGKPGELLEIIQEKEDNPITHQKPIPVEDIEFTPYLYKKEKNNQDGINLPIVLLVEDEQEIREFIRENLKSYYRVYEAENGKTGFDSTLQVEPDIIVSDIVMPVMDGIEMCKKLKSNPDTSHIPILLLTARTGIESKLEGMEIGADGFIEKPFIMDLLLKQIRNILKNRNVLKNKFSQELIVKPSDITITPLDSIILEKAIAIVEKHISDGNFGSSKFAREIGISRSGLHRKLKALTSQTTSEFIQSIRLQRAADLIKNSQLSIEEISIRVGFNSAAYFTKCYKKHFGETPSNFKSEMSEKLRRA